ncbi:MAG: DUF4124 domain-containing protein [Alcanivoracaceae bacterium]|nr:DUF4124 domain-containing protein [Alcanivoracaceae bacterium]
MKPVIWLALIGALASTPVHAQLYRWVDEHGKVHFSDKPVDEENAETVDIKGPPRIGQDDTVQQINDRVRRLHDTENEQREIESKAAAEARERKEEIAKRCKRARIELQKYNGPVYKRELDGSRTYLTDEEHARDKKQIKEWIEQNCKES